MFRNVIKRMVLEYVRKRADVQDAVVREWSRGADIATYHIAGGEVTLHNVNLLNSSITGCRLGVVSNSEFVDSEVSFELTSDKTLD